MSGELNNLRVLLTRLQLDSDDLAAQIAIRGGSSLHLPLFAIETKLHKDFIQELQTKFNNCHLAICVSKNAATIIPHLQPPPEVMWATIGPSTARCLQEYGIENIIYPQQTPYDSAALMQVLKLNNIKLQKQYIMVFTGEHGDNWLQTSLLQQNATVEVVPVYKRIMPSITSDQFINIFNTTPEIDIVLITCITSLVNLMQVAQTAAVEVLDKPLLVVSNRIYEFAIRQGFTKVYAADGMSEQDILVALEKCR